MPRRKQIPQELWAEYRAMSVDVGRLIPFLKQTACMNPEQRKIIALCEQAKEVFAFDKDFCAFIDSFVTPMFEKLGWANWGRDVVSDLGFALSRRQRRGIKLGHKLLEFEPKAAKG